MIAAYNEIVTRHVGTDDVVVAVGHGGSLAWIAAQRYGDPLDIWPGARGGFRNCSISNPDRRLRAWHARALEPGWAPWRGLPQPLTPPGDVASRPAGDRPAGGATCLRTGKIRGMTGGRRQPRSLLAMGMLRCGSTVRCVSVDRARDGTGCRVCAAWRRPVGHGPQLEEKRRLPFERASRWLNGRDRQVPDAPAPIPTRTTGQPAAMAPCASWPCPTRSISASTPPPLRDRMADVQLVIGCGDVPATYLEFLVDSLNVPVYYVLGNHAEELTRVGERGIPKLPDGCINVGGKVVRDPGNGLIIAGLPGSPRYAENEPVQYTEFQMNWMMLKMAPRLYWNRLRHGRALDLLVTHAPTARSQRPRRHRSPGIRRDAEVPDPVHAHLPAARAHSSLRPVDSQHRSSSSRPRSSTSIPTTGSTSPSRTFRSTASPDCGAPPMMEDQVRHDFDRARQRAFRRDLLAAINRRPNDLLPFHELRRRLQPESESYRGLQTVPIAQDRWQHGPLQRFRPRLPAAPASPPAVAGPMSTGPITPMSGCPRSSCTRWATSTS